MDGRFSAEFFVAESGALAEDEMSERKAGEELFERDRGKFGSEWDDNQNVRLVLLEKREFMSEGS